MEAAGTNEGELDGLIFGPVPSRRLGHSLGVNNIPPKICSYSCIYCQLGRTGNLSVKRREFHRPEDVLEAVRRKVELSEGAGRRIDHITFVPDGEPTLDINLGRSIELLGELGIDVAVITNSSLLSREDVREDLMKADYVSLKFDSADPDIWRKINRPHGTLDLKGIVEGALTLSSEFGGVLETETMMVGGVNDDGASLGRTADLLGRISPSVANISIPTRPPAEGWVVKPDENALNAAYQIFRESVGDVRLLIEYEGSDFSSLGDIEMDILGITSVHPMREDAVMELLEKKGCERTLPNRLVKEGYLKRVSYEGEMFYLRNLERSLPER
ncbi:radical SAM protein [Thermoplasmatales archaeon ex4484_6]|nr:MAG: radical SAM protein [Thermoplasmatales archaeon ex4484_6]RLF65523.1 MAG: radical SAM protein [Thermoplasmata archaeon]